MNEQITKKKPIPVIIAGIIGWAHDGFALVLVSLLAPVIAETFAVTDLEIGFVFSAQYIMTVPGAFFFGFLADRLGRKNVLLISVLWDSVFTALSAFAPNFTIFAILRLISGLGVSWGISFSLLSETFSSERRGFAGGLVHSTFVLGYIAAVIITLIFGNIDPVNLGFITLRGWQICFLSALFPVPIVAYLEFSLPESDVWLDYKAAQKGRPFMEEIKSLNFEKKKKIIVLVLSLTLLFWLSEFAYHVLADWAPTYLTRIFTFENGGNTKTASQTSKIVMLVIMVIAGVALFSTGFISDFIGRRKAFVISAVIGLLGSGLFFVFNFVSYSTIMVVVACLVLTISFGMHGVFGVWSSETFPTAFRATLTSLIFSVARAVSFGALIVGAISTALTPSDYATNPLGHAQALAAGMMLATFAYIAILIVIWIIPETRGVDLEKLDETF